MEPSLGAIAFTVPLKTTLTLGFYGLAAAYIVFSAIMYYHWNEYSINKSVTKITLISYVVTTAPLIATLGIIVWSL